MIWILTILISTLVWRTPIVVCYSFIFTADAIIFLMCLAYMYCVRLILPLLYDCSLSNTAANYLFVHLSTCWEKLFKNCFEQPIRHYLEKQYNLHLYYYLLLLVWRTPILLLMLYVFCVSYEQSLCKHVEK